MTETINGWKVSKDSTNRQGRTHFVAKLAFNNKGTGLSLMAGENTTGSFRVEIAIEVNGCVESCFRLDNTANEQEALEMVDNITNSI